MIDWLPRWGAAQCWRAAGRVDRDRRELYGGSTGLRVVCVHETPPGELENIKRVVDFCRGRFAMASPADADDLFEGRWRPGPVDRLLFTFDDGHASHYEAAKWLADTGVSAIFFIVPSLVDRTVAEYLRFHERHGVNAYPLFSGPDERGLTSSQIREIVAMGHRVGAHNFAHRDLGQLHDADSIHYEVANALQSVAELTGRECRDFAIGFGQPENVSEKAAAYLREDGLRVFACHRGLNVPGRTPRFLLRHSIRPEDPMAFTRICLEGGADRRLAGRAHEMVRRVGTLP